MLPHTIINPPIQLPTPKHYEQPIILRALPKCLEMFIARFDGGLFEFAFHFVFGKSTKGET